MRVFVTGAGGQLGRALTEDFSRRGWEVLGSVRGAQTGDCRQNLISLDVADRAGVSSALNRYRPQAVVHCAAWTAVDAAEAEENRETVMAVNALGSRYIAQSCRELGCKLVYISTDYVFDGKAPGLRGADSEDYRPLNLYGLSKLEGELAVRKLTDKHFILRTQWVFGPGGGNFVDTMLRLSESRDCLKVVCDQLGTPSYTRDLARLIGDMCLTEKYGCYNATNEGGYTSWYAFAEEIFRQAGRSTRVLPVTTKEYGLNRAERPLNSRLDRSKLIQEGFEPLPDWRDGLRRYLIETGVTG